MFEFEDDQTFGSKLLAEGKPSGTDAKDPYRIVIVREMWLTGFDAPFLHTMYADKPMQGHGFIQAIARVNRVFRDKPGHSEAALRADGCGQSKAGRGHSSITAGGAGSSGAGR